MIEKKDILAIETLYKDNVFLTILVTEVCSKLKDLNYDSSQKRLNHL